MIMLYDIVLVAYTACGLYNMADSFLHHKIADIFASTTRLRYA